MHRHTIRLLHYLLASHFLSCSYPSTSYTMLKESMSSVICNSHFTREIAVTGLCGFNTLLKIGKTMWSNLWVDLQRWTVLCGLRARLLQASGVVLPKVKDDRSLHGTDSWQSPYWGSIVINFPKFLSDYCHLEAIIIERAHLLVLFKMEISLQCLHN